MTEALIFGSLGVVAVGVFLYFVVKTKPQKTPPPTEIPDDCCGEHAVCMRDSLLTATSEIVYFDDEELDTLANRSPNDFSEQELAMLENIFYTLREQDVAGWLRSLQLRNIALPDELKDEALLIVAERRQI